MKVSTTRSNESIYFVENISCNYIHIKFMHIVSLPSSPMLQATKGSLPPWKEKRAISHYIRKYHGLQNNSRYFSHLDDILSKKEYNTSAWCHQSCGAK